MKEVNSVDLFCGAGGAETGLSLALKDLGLSKRGLAINHWQVAVDTMRANHHDTETLNMDLSSVIPSEVTKAHRIDILWASPTCTHHSRAKGGKPLDNQLRAQPELVLTWLDQLNVVDLCVENVPEFQDWGPLLASGRPDPKRKGNCFRAWVAAIEARGYCVEWCVLNCADFGDATTRRRFFLRARKCSYIGKRGKIRWPEQTHTGDREGDMFLKPWRGVIECLDMSDLGRSIFSRKRPLSENTMRRIFAGLRKYHGYAFQVDFLGADRPEDERRTRALSDPMPAQHTANRTAVVRPFVVRLNKGCDASEVTRPLPTVTAGANHYMLVSPVIFDFLKNCGVRSADDPLPAQTTHQRCAMVSTVIDMSHPGERSDAGRVSSVSDPLGTVTTSRNHALASYVADGGGVIVDIMMRMLKPEEMAAAHSFPRGYRLTGTVAERVKQIGNSVPVETARAICRAVFAGRDHFRDGAKKVREFGAAASDERVQV